MSLPDTLVVPASLSELPRISDWATGLAAKHALPRSTSYAMQLCLEEAVSNIVRHGFAADDQSDRDIRLSFAIAGDAVTLVIEDSGVAFDPTKVAAPAAPTNLIDAPIGGLGIHLMRQFATDLSYERQGGCNRLTLRFETATSGT